MKKTIRALLIVSVAALVGCAAQGPIFSDTPTNSATARIYVYRPSTIINSAGYPYIHINGVRRNPLYNGGYAEFSVAPGPITVEIIGDFLAWGLEDLSLTIRAEAGKTYFARLSSTTTGFVTPVYAAKELHFGLVEESQARSEIAQTTLSQ